ncbi:MAG: putative toxin-antitoxin system toxin component, PIN family, partial [Clostridiales Family XIII bacterium]|nr:putative toxin-antitoxin system toxin component, PIN family [Clostridiales Family XIII bacterium]
MVDTNILVSAILLDSKKLWDMFECIFAKHTLVIASYTADELLDVAERKFPERISVIDRVLEQMPYELVYTSHEIEPGLFEIRDPDDYPVLYTAIKEDVDILISNDRDLLSVEIEAPEIISAHDF